MLTDEQVAHLKTFGSVKLAPSPGRASGAKRKAPIRRESPERAQPSLVGVWGTPQYPHPPSSRQGSGRSSGGGTGAQPCAPTNTEPELPVDPTEVGSVVTLICPVSMQRRDIPISP